MAWAPSWDVLYPAKVTPVPAWWSSANPPLIWGNSAWTGHLDIYQDLMDACTPPAWVDAAGKDNWDWKRALVEAHYIPVHPTQPDTLRTVCIILPTNHKTILDDNPKFKIVSKGPRSHQRSKSMGYLKLRAEAVADPPLTREVYLHKLICYMYKGPPPHDKPLAGHLCEHKLCFCPWHLDWMDHKENMERYLSKKRGEVYDP